MECRLLHEEQTAGKVVTLYEDIRASFGIAPNLFKAQAAVDPGWAALN